MKKYLVFIYTLIGFVAFAQKTHTVAKGDTRIIFLKIWSNIRRTHEAKSSNQRG